MFTSLILLTWWSSESKYRNIRILYIHDCLIQHKIMSVIFYTIEVIFLVCAVYKGSSRNLVTGFQFSVTCTGGSGGMLLQEMFVF